MLDNRVSLWEIPMRTVCVDGVTYVLNKPPERGASCIVYDATKQEMVAGEISPHRVLLKEFYPLLNAENAVKISRQDEMLHLSQKVLNSEEYKQAFEQFKKGFFTIRKLANEDEGAEFLVVPSEMIAANGTWYMVEPYDSGITLLDFLGEKNPKKSNGKSYDFLAFLEIYQKCLETVIRLHKRGFYHLDLKPSNVSYTKGGNIKLFDTDTFLHKDEISNTNVFLTTKGYSAPELELAAEAPTDAPYWIGPWTDVYSLTQFLCWYLFGKPLEEGELKAYLPLLEEKISATFGEFPPSLAPKGIFRLKYFLMRNLSSNPYMRDSSLAKEMLPEIEKIREYLFYFEPGEPVDNFKQCEKPLMGYEEEVEKLEQVLFGTRRKYGYGASRMKTGAVAVGLEQQVREEVARYYATIHRMDYSGIVEVHCNTFEGLIEKLKPEKGVALQNPHEDPILFLLFDRGQEDVLTLKEADEIKQLLEMKNCHVLVVGKYNRLLNVYPEHEKDISLPTVRVDERDTEAFVEDMLELMQENKDIPKWSWKRPAGIALLAIVLFSSGWLLGNVLAETAEKIIYWAAERGTYVCASWIRLTIIMAAHILANGISMLGVTVGIYCIYDLIMPRGIRWFVRQYEESIIAMWVALTSLNMPHAFRAYSFQWLCELFGFSHFQTIENCLEILQMPIWLIFIFMVALWFFQILDVKFKNNILFEVITYVLLILSCMHIIVQTIGNFWELLIHGVLIWLAERYIKKTSLI